MPLYLKLFYYGILQYVSTICVLTDMRTSVSNSGKQKLYDTFKHFS